MGNLASALFFSDRSCAFLFSDSVCYANKIEDPCKCAPSLLPYSYKQLVWKIAKITTGDRMLECVTLWRASVIFNTIYICIVLPLMTNPTSNPNLRNNLTLALALFNLEHQTLPCTVQFSPVGSSTITTP